MKQIMQKNPYVLIFFTCFIIIWLGSAFYTNEQDTVDADSGNLREIESRIENFVVSQNILPYPERVGQDLFKRYCMICHGETGEGNGFNAYMLEVKPRNFTDSAYMNALADNRIAEAIREGGRGVNKSVLMPVWGNTLDELQISFLIRYLRTFSQ